MQHILIASFFLGFVFAFKEWGTSSPNALTGLENWLRYFIMVIIALVLHTMGHKIIAAKNYAVSEFRLWMIQGKIWPIKRKKGPLAVGIIIPLLFSFLSNGLWNVPLVESVAMKEVTPLRARKKFKYLTNFEMGIIALAGPLTSILIALIFKVANLPGFEKFIVINYTIGLFALIPFSTLDGARILSGSKYLYLGSVIFLASTVLLMQVTSLMVTIVLALTLAIILASMLFYKSV